MRGSHSHKNAFMVMVHYTLTRKLITPANKRTAMVLRTSLNTLTNGLSFEFPSP